MQNAAPFTSRRLNCASPRIPGREDELSRSGTSCSTSLAHQDDSGVSKAEQLADQRKEFKRDREMPRSPATMADECILDIFELAENATQKIGDLPSGQIINALCDEVAIDLHDFPGSALLLP